MLAGRRSLLADLPDVFLPAPCVADEGGNLQVCVVWYICVFRFIQFSFLHHCSLGSLGLEARALFRFVCGVRKVLACTLSLLGAEAEVKKLRAAVDLFEPAALLYPVELFGLSVERLLPVAVTEGASVGLV